MPDAGGEGGPHRVAFVHFTLATVEHGVAIAPLLLGSEAKEGRHERARALRVCACRARWKSGIDGGQSAVSASLLYPQLHRRHPTNEGWGSHCGFFDPSAKFAG
jgi:hypothetical protein